MTSPGRSNAIEAALVLVLGSACAAGAAVPFTGTAPRVTNGVLTQARPTTGALLVTDGGSAFAQICSGTLIGCRTFLTAAHCVCEGASNGTCGVPSPGGFAVYLQNAGIRTIEAIDVHPSYEFGEGGDMAVITLAGEVEGIVPTRINSTGRVPFGTAVEIAGFGVTRAGALDSGILRRGNAAAADCADVVNPDSHVCWTFTGPLGEPGENSNTCYGDSGGPLFADLGDGPSVVGITSGGSSPTCLRDDLSWDTDVYVHRAFVESVAAADLLPQACGSDAAVGDPRTAVATFHFDGFPRETADCLGAAMKQWTSYVTRKHSVLQACFDDVNAGDAAGPCPDASAAAALEAAAARLSASELSAKCPEEAIEVAGAVGACGGARSAEELASCLADAADDAVAEALRVEYADYNPTRRIADREARSCQDAVARAGSAFLKAALKARGRCESMKMGGRVPGCPDARTASMLARAEDRARTRIASACSEDGVSVLDAEGGFDLGCSGATDADTLGACQLSEHHRLVDAMVKTLYSPSQESVFEVEVPEGASRLVVTLNGAEKGYNDLDLYLRHAEPASASTFDAKSENSGMFEDATVEAPASGTWHLRVQHYSGVTPISFQLTATVFAP